MLGYDDTTSQGNILLDVKENYVLQRPRSNVVFDPLLVEEVEHGVTREEVIPVERNDILPITSEKDFERIRDEIINDEEIPAEEEWRKPQTLEDQRDAIDKIFPKDDDDESNIDS